MKQYRLYITNASNHNRLETKNANDNPFTKESAIEYGKKDIKIKRHSKYFTK